MNEWIMEWMSERIHEWITEWLAVWMKCLRDRMTLRCVAWMSECMNALRYVRMNDWIKNTFETDMLNERSYENMIHSGDNWYLKIYQFRNSANCWTVKICEACLLWFSFVWETNASNNRWLVLIQEYVTAPCGVGHINWEAVSSTQISAFFK